jgi:ubiquinone/menaquinone biosynthesis C-methylase UbiE
MGRIKAWITLIFQMGPIAGVAKQFETLNRFFVLNTLKLEGLFDFISSPQTYKETLDHFKYEDSKYTRDLLEIIRNDRNKIVIYSEEDKTFKRNPSAKLPELKDLLSVRSFERIYQASKVPQKFAQNIPNRLRGESKGFAEDLKEPGPSLFDYNEALTHKLYTAMRNSAFAFIDTNSLLGKKILDVGCGAGRETAELWIKFKGQSKIVGVDPVESFIETAKSQFSSILQETIQIVAKNKILPDLTEENHPEFYNMPAEDLQFDDASFDVAFLQQILHWTSDAKKAISEISRVLKPGGMFFGSQGTLPLNTPYMDIMIRAHEKVIGFFSLEDLKKWIEEANLIEFKRTTPAGIFKVYKKQS